MNLLNLIWNMSLVLVATSVIWLSYLVVMRLNREQRDKSRDLLREKLRMAFLQISSGADHAVVDLIPLRGNGGLVAETFLEFLSLVRGAEQERLIEAFRESNVDEMFRELLNRGDKSARFFAIEALAAFPSIRTTKAVDTIFDNTRIPGLRAAAVRTLIEIGSYPSVRDVVSRIGADGASGPLLLDALCRLSVHTSDEMLALVKDGQLELGAQAALVEALGASGNYLVLDTLEEAAADPRPKLRIAALNGMILLAHPSVSMTLADCLKDTEWSVRAIAAEAVGTIGLPSLAENLGGCMDDPVWWVRYQAANALLELGEAGHKVLSAGCQSMNGNVRRTASLALAEGGAS